MPTLPQTRIKPICPYFEMCGGCDIQDISYEDQIKYKKEWLEELFLPLADQTKWKRFIHSPESYPIFFRNKIRYGFVVKEGSIYPSRHSKGSEEADIAVNKCFLQSEESVEVMNFTADFAQKHGWTIYNPLQQSGWLKHILIRQSRFNKEMMVSLVTDHGPIKDESDWITSLTSTFPFITSLYQTLTWGKSNEQSEDRHLWGDAYIYERVGELTFRISPHAFFQTNSAMVESLYQAIADTTPLNKSAHVWDLYAGSATIGSYLSPKVKSVLSIESNPENCKDALDTLTRNTITNLEVLEGKVEQVLTSSFLTSHALPSHIVVDPPRAGLAKELYQLLPHIGSHTLIYVSCNPLTCLRDCRELIKRGYQLVSLQGVDMFPHTYHCEVIAQLTRVS